MPQKTISAKFCVTKHEIHVVDSFGYSIVGCMFATYEELLYWNTLCLKKKKIEEKKRKKTIFVLLLNGSLCSLPNRYSILIYTKFLH